MISRAPEEPRFAGALALSLAVHLAMGYGAVALVRGGAAAPPMDGMMSVRLVPLAGGPAGPGPKRGTAVAPPRPAEPEPKPAPEPPPPEPEPEPEPSPVRATPPAEEKKPEPPVPDRKPEPVPEDPKPAAVKAPAPEKKEPTPKPEPAKTPKPKPAATQAAPTPKPSPKPVATPPTARTEAQAPPGPAGPAGPAFGGGGGGGPVAGLGPGMSLDSPFPYPWYLELLRRRVSEAWVKPNSAAGLERGTVIYFRVLSDGSLGLVEVERASGLDMYDRSALRAIHSMGRLPPLPTGFREAYLGVHFEFIP